LEIFLVLEKTRHLSKQVALNRCKMRSKSKGLWSSEE